MVISIPIVSTFSNKGARDAEGALGKLEGLATKATGALAAAFAVEKIISFGMESIKAAEAANGAFAKLNTAFANTGSSLNQLSPQVQEAVDKMSGLAFTGTDTADALARGATIFHNTATPLKNLSLAADIARASGMSLTDAMVALGKASEGRIPKSLAALGAVFPKNGTAAEKYKAVLDSLTESLKGQADAYAQTHPLEVMRSKMEELSVSIGQVLMPAFKAITGFIGDKLIPSILKFINFLRENPKYIQPFLDVLNVVLKVIRSAASGFLEAANVVLLFAKGLVYADLLIAKVIGDKKTAEQDRSIIGWLDDARKKVNEFNDSLNKLPINFKATAAKPIVLKAVVSTSTSATGSSGVDKTAMSAIELEAARLNTIKQNNVEEINRLKVIQDQFDLQLKNNEAAQKYADIMQALADNQISTQEVAVLAQKWGMSSSQVEEYIGRIYAANSTGTNTDAIVQLYMAWGMTKEEAQRYIDFAVALKDQKLDDSEIGNLMNKWHMTRQEVVDYGAKVAGGTAFSSTWSDGGDLAKKSWEDALTALNAYLAALRNSGGGGGGGGGASGGTGSTTTPSTTPPLGSQSPTMTGIIPQPTYVSSSVSTFGVTAASNTLGAFGSNLSAKANESPTVVVNVGGSVVSQTDLVSAVQYGILGNKLSGKAVEYNQIAL